MIEVLKTWPCENVWPYLNSFAQLCELLSLCCYLLALTAVSIFLKKKTDSHVCCLRSLCLYFESFVWIFAYLVNKVAMVDALSNRIYAWHPWVWFAQKGVENYPLGKKAWSLSNQVHSWHPCLQLASKDVRVDFILVGWGVDRPGPFMTPMFTARVRKALRQENK